MEIENIENILARRKKIEVEIVEMLKETESDFTLDHVRDAIYNEEDNDDMMKVIAMFDPSSRTPGVHYGAGKTQLLVQKSKFTPLDMKLSNGAQRPH